MTRLLVLEMTSSAWSGRFLFQPLLRGCVSATDSTCEDSVISRVWHGWTTPENADTYQQLLVTTILPGIAARQIAGYLGVRLDRRDAGHEVEFVTTMLFESEAAIAEFAGPDSSVSVVPAAARAVLSRFDEHATHYAVVAGGCPRAEGDAEPYPLTQPSVHR